MVCGSLLITVAIAALGDPHHPGHRDARFCQRLLRPLRRFGVDPDRVGLVLALTIRCIPLLVDIVRAGLGGEKGSWDRILAAIDGRAGGGPGFAGGRRDG